MTHSLGTALRDASGAAALSAVVGFAAVAVQRLVRRQRMSHRSVAPRTSHASTTADAVRSTALTGPRWAVDPADLTGGFLHAEHPHAPTSHRPRRTRIA